ncbi:MAG: 4-hydroxythreonine-4-phosphate dehydrogenase PdxA [Armatimonadota bacterium]|nr:4-hydroxythreonine-4-phosphate dehydrogenase PdxA [Armatimonadota bacterium]MDW8156519.1 4-hydroxythreonine-4-phosphate dehydrogenase PdxA [Armatimonadota bacterium]
MARVAVAMGDPSGVGPEVLAKALQGGFPHPYVVVGDRAVWEEACRLAGVDLPVQPADVPVRCEGGTPFLQVDPPERGWVPGRASAEAGRAAAAWLQAAVRLALQGSADAVVFAPLNKQALRLAGLPVRDEYEFVAHLAGVREHDEVNVIPHPAGSGLLWVARATSHVPLREVPLLLDEQRVLRAVRVAHGMARRAGNPRPRVGVAALNPHAGEGGTLGDEEVRILAPAIRAAREEGMDVSGPYPADHIFRIARLGALDAVVALYHDQTQIATKLLGFERGVSVGVGYPFVMTTPSHGTAFDIVGTSRADPRPMRQALELAAALASSDG